MKAMKKMVLVGLVLLASVVVLAGCKNDSVPEEPKYTVKFAKGNNTEVVSDLPSNLMVESGTVLTAEQLKTLSHTENYAFVGWYDGETKAVAGTYTVTKDVILTAQWKKAIRVTQENLNEGLDTAITDPDRILVLKDNITVKMSIYISSGNVTIDLNGKTLKNESSIVVQVAENATLTIMDTGKGGSISGGSYGVSNKGSLTVEGGIISASGANCYGVYNDGSLKVEGGEISGDSYGVFNYGSLTVEGGSISGAASGVGNAGTLTVKGGNISASGENSDGVNNNNSGTLEVTGGSISGGSSGVSNNGSLTVEGGSISGGSYGVSNSGSLTVTGGIISASGENIAGVYNNGSGKLTVEGGSISGGSSGVSNYGSLKVKGGCISASGENSVGVYNNGSGTLEVTGGSISGGSSGVSNNGSLNLSGAPTITTSDESGAAFLLKKLITIVGALTGDGIDYSVKWEGERTGGTTIVIGGEQVTLTADIAQKFTFTDIKVEFDKSTKALVVKN